MFDIDMNYNVFHKMDMIFHIIIYSLITHLDVYIISMVHLTVRQLFTDEKNYNVLFGINCENCV